MGFRFVLGRAGAGKTYHCLASIARLMSDDRREATELVLLVPEQATFQTEYALARFLPRRGFARCHVLSFSRLARMVFGEVGGPGGNPLDEPGRMMLLAWSFLQNRDKLAILGRARLSAELVRRIYQSIRELRALRIGPQELSEYARALASDGGYRSRTAEKIRDLSVLYEDYRRRTGKGLVDMAEYLDEAARLLPLSPTLRHAVVWVDGFADFTPQQIHLLRALARVATHMEVALCLDPDGSSASAPISTSEAAWAQEGGFSQLFGPTLDTYRRLSQNMEQAGVQVLPPVLLRPEVPPRFKDSPELRLIESRLFGSKKATGEASPFETTCLTGDTPYADSPRALRIVRAPSPPAEVLAAAEHILSLAGDHGIPFGQIAVIADLEIYGDLISGTFQAHGIPVFLDRKVAASCHPLAKLLRYAIEAAVSGFEPEAISRLHNTGLSRARGDVARRAVTRFRHRLERAAGAAGSLTARQTIHPAAATEALRELLDELDVAGTLSGWAREAVEAGDLLEAFRHRRAWSNTCALIEELEDIITEPVSLSAFATLLLIGLDSLTLGFIPPALDQVVVGPVDRSRRSDVAAACLLGVNQGSFPTRLRHGDLLSETDRHVLFDAGAQVLPAKTYLTSWARYLSYIAVTRPSRYLWLSYSTSDSRGRPGYPSGVIRAILRMFPDLVEEEVSAGQRQNLTANATGETIEPRPEGSPESRLKERVEAPFSLGASPDTPLAESPALPPGSFPGVSRAGSAATTLAVEPTMLTQLQAEVRALSVTQLEEYAFCGFFWFCRRVLGLKPEEPARLVRLAVGTAVHRALSGFVLAAREEGLDWDALEIPRVLALARKALDNAFKEAASPFLLSSDPANKYLTSKAREQVERVALLTAIDLKRTGFRPYAVEMEFELDFALLPALIRPGKLPSTLPPLKGRIDRVDVRVQEDTVLVRVVDYKTAPTYFKKADLEKGLSLQLPLYLLAALNETASAFRRNGRPFLPLPAGMFYVPVLKPARFLQAPPAENEGTEEAATGEELEADGVAAEDVVSLPQGAPLGPGARTVSRASLQELLALAAAKAAELTERIASGEVRRSGLEQGSQRPCVRCPYLAICQPARSRSEP